MAKYLIDISSYDAFRNQTFGKLYDVDNAFNSQCFDAVALLWDNLGRKLSSGGTGAAKGCWEQARVINTGDDFLAISDVKSIKRGDVIVFGSKLGEYGHIGFADEDYASPQIATYSQNQGGTNGQGQAAAFCVKKYNSDALIGAFRFKGWADDAGLIVSTNKSLDDVAVDARHGKYGDGDERIKRLTDEGFTPTEIKEIQAKINLIIAKENAEKTNEYNVKLTTSALNVRKGPGTDYPIVKVFIGDKNIHTIIDWSDGVGATKWGKLKTGPGWISLDHTSKI